ncbi:MAG: ABC transporter permease [Peptococcaceae bacterium]|jgi:peptide/nickel transport system permease protein|nr:ABC transporter permease [Peptococcaceae bacterium]
MPKMSTPAIEAFQKKQKARPRLAAGQGKENAESVSVPLWVESWRRLVRRPTAVLGMIIFLALVSMALFPSLIAPEGYDNQQFTRLFLPPNGQNIMGTDNLGRDVFSRVVYGASYSMRVGFFAVLSSCLFGGVLGSIAAFYGSRVDNIIMRFLDIILSIPSILLAIAITSVLGASLTNLIIAISVSDFPHYARIVRASILGIKEQEFVEAARAIGASDARIIFRHLLPNAMAPIIVQATVGLGMSILSCASLSFIGLGIQPPLPEWGTMLSTGREYIREYWWLVVFPGMFIMLAVFSVNLFGDGLRDALDPRLKR